MLKAILIDDEESSLSSLKQKIIQHCPEVEIIALCNTAAMGIQAIDNMHPELVFLDIEMPIMNGFILLQQITFKNFELIFVTAYDHYAIKAIRCSALDYLVKPVEIENLREAVQRAVDKKANKPNERIDLLLENSNNEKKKINKIAIPTLEELHFVKLDDIIFLEASGNYTKFNLTHERKYLVSKTLKSFEEILPSDTFLRIHNSYIINKDFVERYIRGDGGQVALTGNIILEISKRKKSEFLKALGA